MFDICNFWPGPARPGPGPGPGPEGGPPLFCNDFYKVQASSHLGIFIIQALKPNILDSFFPLDSSSTRHRIPTLVGANKPDLTSVCHKAVADSMENANFSCENMWKRGGPCLRTRARTRRGQKPTACPQPHVGNSHPACGLLQSLLAPIYHPDYK